MGLFSKIFKSATKTTVETLQGHFTLVYSNKNRNLWSNDSGSILKTVRGTEREPDAHQLNFIEHIENEITKLGDKINQNFVNEFNEAEEAVDFKDWTERFNLTAVDVEAINQDIPYWTITFEDQRASYAHFNLHIEGYETRGFSIDT